jgi:hypothetical protein
MTRVSFQQGGLMRKRIYLLPFLIVGMLSIISCVSPYYGTARIEPGFHLDAGLSISTFIPPVSDGPGYAISPHVDLESKYGFNEYLQTHARFSAGFSYPYSYFDAGAGLQAAVPLGIVTPAVRSEVTCYGGFLTFSPAFLAGFGRNEFLTVGMRTHWDFINRDQSTFPFEIFVTGHISQRWAIFLGGEIHTLRDMETHGDPILTLGIGYNYTR